MNETTETLLDSETLLHDLCDHIDRLGGIERVEQETSREVVVKRFRAFPSAVKFEYFELVDGRLDESHLVFFLGEGSEVILIDGTKSEDGLFEPVFLGDMVKDDFDLRTLINIFSYYKDDVARTNLTDNLNRTHSIFGSTLERCIEEEISIRQLMKTFKNQSPAIN